MRPLSSQEHKPPLHDVDAQRRLWLMQQYGSFPLAYSATFQPDMSHFGNRHGFLAYKQIGSTAFVLSDPVASPGDRENLIREFTAARNDACFRQVSRAVAGILARHGFRVSALGLETQIALGNYGFAGPRKRTFRRAIGRAARAGIVVAERPVASLDREELNTLSKRWRQSRKIKDREMTFLTRPAILADEVDVRKFFAFGRDGKLQAFAFFDPIYENGDVRGYLCSAKRRDPEADALVGYVLLHSAIEAFIQEGRQVLSLGLSPLCMTEGGDVTGGRLLEFGFRSVYRSRAFNKFIYPVRGLSIHKGSFCGSVEPVYCAFTRGRILSQLLKMPRACNLTHAIS